jgi:adenylate cyclase, class 2
MAEEIEAKWLDIDPKSIAEKLESLGAKKEFDRMYRVRIFDYPGFTLNAKAAWMRVRDEGDKVTMSYKQRIGNTGDKSGKTNDEGMIEHEVVVSSFDETADILHSLGMIDKFYEEKKRIRYTYDGIEFDIDTMPGIPTFLEIEARSWADIDRGAELLSLNPDEKRIFSAFQIYALNGIDMLEYSEFRFDGLVKREKEIV